MRTWIEDALAGEAQMMGRPVTFRNAWETEFHGTDGKLRIVRMVVYDVQPHEVGGRTWHQTRVVLLDGSGYRSTSTIIDPEEAS